MRFSHQIKDVFSRSTTVCNDRKMDGVITLGEEAYRKLCDEQNILRVSALHTDTRIPNQSGTILKPIRLSTQSTTAINYASRGRSWRSPSPVLHTGTSKALQQAQGLYTSIALCPVSLHSRSSVTDLLRLQRGCTLKAILQRELQQARKNHQIDGSIRAVYRAGDSKHKWC